MRSAVLIEGPSKVADDGRLPGRPARSWHARRSRRGCQRRDEGCAGAWDSLEGRSFLPIRGVIGKPAKEVGGREQMRCSPSRSKRSPRGRSKGGTPHGAEGYHTGGVRGRGSSSGAGTGGGGVGGSGG